MINFASVLLLLAAVGRLWVYHTVRMGQEVEALHRSGSETTGEMKRVWFAGRRASAAAHQEVCIFQNPGC